MPVPEASVNEYCSPVLREDYVRLARKVLAMEPEPEAESVQCATQRDLWRGV